jgi:hypothetical protein
MIRPMKTCAFAAITLILVAEVCSLSDTFRWTRGAINSELARADNQPQYILTGNNARIAATLRYVKLVMPFREITLLRADLSIANIGTDAFDVVPDRMHLMVIAPSPKGLIRYDPPDIISMMVSFSRPPNPGRIDIARSNAVTKVAEEYVAGALKAKTVKPGEMAVGALFFAIGSNAANRRTLQLSVPAATNLFEFPVDIELPK